MVSSRGTACLSCLSIVVWTIFSSNYCSEDILACLDSFKGLLRLDSRVKGKVGVRHLG